MQMHAKQAGSGSIQDIVYGHLRSAILAFQFRPGERLRAQDVASRLNVSRTPVREALSRLEQEGLVQRAGWGYTLPQMSLKEAIDFYKVREILEVAAAGEAVTKMSGFVLSELARVIGVAEKALKKDDIDQFRRNIREFRRIIAGVVDNDCLSNLLSSIDDRVHLLSAMLFDRHVDRAHEVLKEYRMIFKAVKAGHVKATQHAVRKHIEASRQALINYVLTTPRER